jgi:hypothetical protein
MSISLSKRYVAGVLPPPFLRRVNILFCRNCSMIRIAENFGIFDSIMKRVVVKIGDLKRESTALIAYCEHVMAETFSFFTLYKSRMALVFVEFAFACSRIALRKKVSGFMVFLSI